MISVEHLSKKYGDFLAVDDLSFEIEDGHIYGFLGPNGAGKSTTLNIMTGCLAATEGTVTIDGHDIFEDEREAKKLIGYLPEMPPLYVEQTPREYLEFVAEAKGVSKADRPAEIAKVIEETHIEDMADKLIKHLSKGYRQRVGIAQALLGNPSVIILDEPTVGLDPMQIIEIRDLIEELGKKHTVILSSHILSEVQAICEKVLIIYKGKLVAFDEPENLSRSLSAGNTIELVAEAEQDQIIATLDSVESITKTELKSYEEGRARVLVYTAEDDPLECCRSIYRAFKNSEGDLLMLNPVNTTLEDIFIELTSADENGQLENFDLSEDESEKEDNQ